MPARDRPACDCDEQDWPDGAQDALRIEQEWPSGHLDLDVRKRRRERTHEDQDDRGVRRIERQVIRWLDERRCGKNRSQIQDDRGDERPERQVPNPERPTRRRGQGEQDAEIDARNNEHESDSCDREHVHLDTVQELSTEESGEENADGCDERAPERVPEGSDECDERCRDDDEIEQDEGEEVRPPPSPGKLVRDRTEGAALLPDRQHH